MFDIIRHSAVAPLSVLLVRRNLNDLSALTSYIRWGRDFDVLLGLGSDHSNQLDRPDCSCRGGISDQGDRIFSPRNHGNSPAIPKQLERGTMPSIGRISTADWPRTCHSVGCLPVCRSVDGSKVAVAISCSDIADCHAVDKLCLGGA